MSSTTNSIKSDTVNYLLLYEAMVRHQDLEFDATSDHIKLTIGRIKLLGKRPQLIKSKQLSSTLALTGGGGGGGDNDEEEVPNDMITYREMRRCLLRLGYTWNRTTNAMTTTEYNNYYDDDNISVISNNSSSTRYSGGGASGTSGSAAAGGFGNVRDIIATDAQLIMLLTTLVEMEERYHYSSTSSDSDSKSKNDKDVFPQGLFIAEFVQAYKLIIGGMQSLQTYPSPQQQQQHENNNKLLQELRTRSRERTLGLLRLFGPDSSLYTKSLAGSSSSSSLQQQQQQSAGESPAGRNQKKRNAEDGLSLTPNRSPSKKKGGGNNKEVVAKDGLLPRLTDAEIRKMVHSKDIALAKILEEHETEMNVMAMNMEELRLKNLRTNATLKKRKKRARVIIVAMTLLLTIGGGCMEYMKREQVKREIASGREVERKADTELIAKLQSEIEVLSSKLSDAEATIRYEESRYDTIKQLSYKNEKLLEDMEHKWKIESAELEKCRVSRKELDGQVTSLKLKNVEMEEEVTWCRERLASTESAMEGMERVLSKSRNENKKGGVSFSEIVKAVELEKKEGDDDDDDENKEKNSKKQPVLMEMKYNKSFRNAVFLRQAYSAVAGVAASVLLQGLLPGVANVIRMIFFK
jgi:hypothetical protein